MDNNSEGVLEFIKKMMVCIVITSCFYFTVNAMRLRRLERRLLAHEAQLKRFTYLESMMNLFNSKI